MKSHEFVIAEAKNGYIVLSGEDEYIFDNVKDVLSFIEEKIYNPDRE